MVHTWKRVGRPISISFKMFELKNIYLFVWRYIYMYMKWLLLFLKLVKKKNFNGIEIPWCMFLTDVYNFIIQLYALQEKQTLMKTDMDSRFTSESEARYVDSSLSTHELRPC